MKAEVWERYPQELSDVRYLVWATGKWLDSSSSHDDYDLQQRAAVICALHGGVAAVIRRARKRVARVAFTQQRDGNAGPRCWERTTAAVSSRVSRACLLRAPAVVCMYWEPQQSAAADDVLAGATCS